MATEFDDGTELYRIDVNPSGNWQIRTEDITSSILNNAAVR